jgi:putative addiction module component (TIGR02574 family)
MSVAEIRRLPISKKLQLMEVLWEDLRFNAEHSAVPKWQKNLLDSRRAAVQSGTDKIFDWDEVKNAIGKRSG